MIYVFNKLPLLQQNVLLGLAVPVAMVAGWSLGWVLERLWLRRGSASV